MVVRLGTFRKHLFASALFSTWIHVYICVLYVWLMGGIYTVHMYLCVSMILTKFVLI